MQVRAMAHRDNELGWNPRGRARLLCYLHGAAIAGPVVAHRDALHDQRTCQGFGAATSKPSPAESTLKNWKPNNLRSEGWESGLVLKTLGLARCAPVVGYGAVVDVRRGEYGHEATGMKL